MSRPFSAMVLAAGFGSRLLPLSAEIPKPLLPIGDRPLILSTLDQLNRLGARSMSVNVHHLGREIASSIARFSREMHVAYEEKILGTAGGIRAASSSFVAPTVIVVNGDMSGDLPVLPLLESKQTAAVVLAVSLCAAGSGTVGLGADGRVVRLRGESFGSEVAGADYLGVARLSQAVWGRFPEQGCLVGDFLLPALRQGETFAAVAVAEKLTDIGTLEGYFAANMQWLGTVRGPVDSYVAPSARCATSVQLVESIVGAGAAVEGEGILRRVVALPGARVAAPLEDAMVTPSGRVIRCEARNR